MKNCCYVTMYYDIDRSGWETFSRSFETYLERFKPFVPLFHKASCENNHLIVFIDDRHVDALAFIDVVLYSIKIIPINKKFLEDHIFCWSLLSRERDIMNSPSYQNMILHRNHCPETRFPEYTLLNHSKIDFLNYVISKNLTPLSMCAWVDFGFFSSPSLVPSTLLDMNHFDITKINYTLIQDIDQRDNDIFYTLKYAPEKIGGFFFLGKKDALQVYQKLYHTCLLEYQQMGICDDDQALALYCYFKNPDLFSFPAVRGWHNVLKTYCAVKPTKKVVSFCLWGEEKKYTVGLIENLKLISFFYPDFASYIYIHHKTATQEYINEIKKSHHNVKIFIKNDEKIRPKRCMLWRIEPLMDKSVDLFISRDIDTRIFPREVLAVRQWLRSEKILHIMRDHPQHYNRILGGMFGVRTESFKSYNWTELIESYYKIHGEEENDQHFLQKFLYNMTFLGDKMIHDEIKKYEGNFCLPFPCLYDQSHFTGCYIYEDGSGDPETEIVLRRYLTHVSPHRYNPTAITFSQKLNYLSEHIDCIYIIHYSKLKSRRDMMEKQLENHLFDLFFKDRIKWVDVFDREYLDYSQYGTSFYSPEIFRNITKGEIANMTAHRYVFDDITLKSSHYSGNFLVIEDDCIFKENFVDNLYQAFTLLENNNNNNNWDMVCLGGPTVLNVEPARALDKSTKMNFHVNEIEVFTPSSPAPCTVSAMLYKKSGLAKIASSTFIKEPYLFPSDHALWEANKENKISMKWIQPFLTYEGSKNDLFCTSFTERGF